MTCARHLTFTSRDCSACQRNRTTTAPAVPGGTDTTVQTLLTQSILTNTASACEVGGQSAPASYCDTSAPATFADPGCPPSC